MDLHGIAVIIGLHRLVHDVLDLFDALRYVVQTNCLLWHVRPTALQLEMVGICLINLVGRQTHVSQVLLVLNIVAAWDMVGRLRF